MSFYFKQSYVQASVSFSDAKAVMMKAFGLGKDWKHLTVKVYIGLYEVV